MERFAGWGKRQIKRCRNIRSATLIETRMTSGTKKKNESRNAKKNIHLIWENVHGQSIIIIIKTHVPNGPVDETWKKKPTKQEAQEVSHR